MIKFTTHWLVDAINQHHADTLPDDALPASINAINAWRMLHHNFGLSFSFIATAVADTYGLQAADTRQLKRIRHNPFSEKFCRKLNVLPFNLDLQKPLIATFDPRLSADHHQQIQFLLGHEFELVVVSPDDIETALTFLYSPAHELESRKSIDLEVCHVNESDTVQLAKAIFREAIDKRASDIHIHPLVGGAAIRFRIDGLLVRIATIPQKTLDSLTNYLNVQANLESNPFIPQDGRLSLKYATRMFDVRLSLLPAFDGMRIVCRLLEQGKQFSLSQAGFSVADYQALTQLINWGSGIILLTGPTGSGKTSTLYSLLNELNTSDVNIVTLEDPVEYVLPGISQVQVNKHQGRSFTDTLKAILRQDPDILLIGEIRDKETAHIAAQASLTGHLVFSTLHTNDAIAAIPRLLDLELNPTILADALIGVVSQRLVRRLCPHCKAPVKNPLHPMESEFLRITKELPHYRAMGCDQCGFSGYLGRLPITEVMEISPAMRTLLLSGTFDIRALENANQGFKTSMATGAMQWIVSGETTPDEVYRELGLRFLNELASRFHKPLSSKIDRSHTHPGHKPGLLLLSNRQDLDKSLAFAMPFEIIATTTETEAATALKNNNAIIAIIIDGNLLHCEPEEWLSSLRSQLAWAGIPVIFLLYPHPGSEKLHKLLNEFNAHTIIPDLNTDLSTLIAHKLSIIFSTGGLHYADD